MPSTQPAPTTRRPPRAWPSLCAVCQGWGRSRVCAACHDRFASVAPRCMRCALAVPEGVAVCGACLAAPPAFDGARARVDYGFPWDGLVAAFKFRDALDLASTLSRGIVEAVEASSPETVDVVLPVPLAPARGRERGYNQSWELARRVAHALALASEARALVRVRETAHQRDLPPDARAGNVRHAFAVDPDRRAAVAGRSIAVVDDVLTTGGTAAEIATTLRAAGAARVVVWVFARTPRPDVAR